MTRTINEYRTKSVLSEKSREFVDNYTDGPIPEEIKAELEKYLADNQQYFLGIRSQLESQFAKVLKGKHHE